MGDYIYKLATHSSIPNNCILNVGIEAFLKPYRSGLEKKKNCLQTTKYIYIYHFNKTITMISPVYINICRPKSVAKQQIEFLVKIKKRKSVTKFNKFHILSS